MTPAHFIWYSLTALVLVVYVRRWLRHRSITHYTPGEVAARLKNGSNTVLLDVRTAAERGSQSIKGSLHIPLQQLHARIDHLQKFKDKEIICYCRSGNRSLTAAATLRKHGFTTANMKGGITGWNFSGHT